MSPLPVFDALNTLRLESDKTPIDEEMLQFIADDFLDRAESIEGVVVQEKLTIFTIGEYPAARVMAFDTETLATYSFMAFELNDEMIAIITTIGQTDDVRILQGTILAIANSMTVE